MEQYHLPDETDQLQALRHLYWGHENILRILLGPQSKIRPTQLDYRQYLYIILHLLFQVINDNYFFP